MYATSSLDSCSPIYYRRIPNHANVRHPINYMTKTHHHPGLSRINTRRTRSVYSGRAESKLLRRLGIVVRAVPVGAHVPGVSAQLVDSVDDDVGGFFVAGLVDMRHIGVETHDGLGKRVS